MILGIAIGLFLGYLIGRKYSPAEIFGIFTRKP